MDTGRVPLGVAVFAVGCPVLSVLPALMQFSNGWTYGDLSGQQARSFYLALATGAVMSALGIGVLKRNPASWYIALILALPALIIFVPLLILTYILFVSFDGSLGQSIAFSALTLPWTLPLALGLLPLPFPSSRAYVFATRSEDGSPSDDQPTQ